MPKSDTWPGGTESATMNGMDSAGSCDSVVSANSGFVSFSEDSLEHLSAEEKACLMFLEETIESLENEDDSGLSHDEPEQLPAYGNISAKLADLSHSLGKSSQKPSNQPIKKNVDTKHMQSYLIPTPLVVASGSQCSVPSTKSLTPVDKTASPKSQFRFKHNKPAPSHNEKRTAPPVPSGVNVIPPSTKPRENSAKPAEGPLTRGPLSYDALVHLRRNASQKKTPLCPTVDHTIDLDRQCPPPLEVSKLGNVTKPDKSLSDMNKPKVVPPVVVKQATNPEVVRLEALQKLGLLKGHEHEDGAKPLSKKPARDPSDPTRNALFCSSQETAEPKNRPLKNSASVHQPSKEEQQPVLLLHVQSQSSGLKTEGLEHSAKQDDYKNKGKHPRHKFYGKSTKTATTSQFSSDTPVDSVGYTAMMVPGVGSDRKEALRKLGLLKR
uniref:Specifically androgen-regulated gene protein n=1 Tax=Poecilia mexicana TaxID=48701 RepID=A0A3B3Y4M8_9TELE